MRSTTDGGAPAADAVPSPGTDAIDSPDLAARRLAETLRSGGEAADRELDGFLPEALRRIASRYWTPLSIARRAARWFDDLGVLRVADIGSGVGKFCVAAALSGEDQGRIFVGLEQRPELVAAARALAVRFAVDHRVHFVEGALGEVETPAVEGYYLFNPFGENLYDPEDCLDTTVELGDARYGRDIAAMEDLLRRAPPGTFVLTYNGFGGRVPATYRRVESPHGLPQVLQMWRNTAAPGEDRSRRGDLT